MVINREYRSEVAIVQQVTQDGTTQRLVLSRPKPIDFSQPPGKYPEDWQCPFSWYNDSKTCDCNCGAPDADCDRALGLPVTRCPLPYAVADAGAMCSPNGYCTNDPTAYQKYVFVSEACNMIFAPGETQYVGFVGDEETFRSVQQPTATTAQSSTDRCSICPGDEVYGGNPAMGQDGVWRCFETVIGNVQSDLPRTLTEYADSVVAQGAGLRSGRSSSNATVDPVSGSNVTSTAANCTTYSQLWGMCMDLEYMSLESWMYIRFERVGMSFPVVNRDSGKRPVVEVLLDTSVRFTGEISYSDPPQQAMQLIVIRPMPTAPPDPSSRLSLIDAILLSAIDYESTSVFVACTVRDAKGDVVCYNNGVDKNFLTRMGRTAVQIHDTLAASQLTGIAGKPIGDSSTTLLSPDCGGIEFGTCKGPLVGMEAKTAELRFTRRLAINMGRKVTLRSFPLCGDMDPADCPKGSRHLVRTAEANKLFDGIIDMNAVRNRNSNNATAVNGMDDNETSANGDENAPSRAEEYVFPENRRPIVIIKSRGQVVEVRLVNATAGSVLRLDRDLEGDIDFPCTIETTYDGEDHACSPPHHPCVHTLYRVRVKRSEAAYLPQDRYKKTATEPTVSPSELQFEVAMFRVPLAEASKTSMSTSTAGRRDGDADDDGRRDGNVPERAGYGQGNGDGDEHQKGSVNLGFGGGREGQESHARAHVTTRGVEHTTQHDKYLNASRGKGTRPDYHYQKNRGAKSDRRQKSSSMQKKYLCPNQVSSTIPTPKFSSFGWDQWSVRPDREFQVGRGLYVRNMAVL